MQRIILIPILLSTFLLFGCSKNDSIVLDCRLIFIDQENHYLSPTFDEVTVVIDRSNQSITIINREAISTPIDGRVCADGIGITRCMFIKTYFKSSNQDWEETANYFKVSGLQVDRRTLLISHNINPIISPTLECIKFDDRKI